MKRLLLFCLLCAGCSNTPLSDKPLTTKRNYTPTPAPSRKIITLKQRKAGVDRPVTKKPTPIRPALSPAPKSSPSPNPGLSPSPGPTSSPKKLVLPSPDRPRSLSVQGPDDRSSAASWRSYAQRCLEQKSFAEASLAFAQEAAIYRKKGDLNAAFIEQLKSDRYRTQIQLFYWRPSDNPKRPLERLEPSQGCMVGAFIDRDDGLAKRQFGPQSHGNIIQFNELTQKRHASFFTYLNLQRDFPRPWADYVGQQGAIPHLAWEPDHLDHVTPELIERFVQALCDYDAPVIVRFASEMNGDWTRYHGDPEYYRQVFRRLYQAMRRAPKAALLWCPNAVPANKISQYYPGDDGCDWVGVNFYSVPYLDNNPQRPGDWIHPIDLLNTVYAQYHQRKPIAIGEYAASHQSVLDPTLKIDFARIKMAQLYQSLPLLFQDVKLVNWYDCDNISRARSERQLNNFRLTDQEIILKDYQRWISDPWYLAAGKHSAPRQAYAFPQELPGPVDIQPWVRSYQANPQVFLRLNGQVVHFQQLPEASKFRLPSLKAGKHKLEVLVYEASGQFIDKKTYNFTLN